jgi:hypothetical protein
MNPRFLVLTLLVSFAMSTEAADPNWVVVNEFGQSKVYVDSASIERTGGIARVRVKYVLTPNGTDKRNGKAVKEMLMSEEYDTAGARFRVRRILFTYSDGAVADPLLSDGEWRPATDGNEKTLNYLRHAR